MAAGVTGLVEVGSHHAGVDPGGGVLRELGQESDSALDEQRAGLLQPRCLAAVAHVALGAQQEVSHLSICREKQP